MTHKHCFEAVDRTFNDILQFHNNDSLNLPFGGKVVVMGGDFRQILPVISKGTRQEIVHATINSSYLWQYCQDFSNWVLKHRESNDEYETIQLPKDMVINNLADPLATIVDNTYPSILDNMRLFWHLRMIGEAKTYLSFDNLSSCNINIDRPDDSIMLLRNINQPVGLCNDTKLIVTQMGGHVLEAKVISGSNIGQKFPVDVCFAMTINKIQGESFKHLYVAISRVNSCISLKILSCDNEGNTINMTSNVIYKEAISEHACASQTVSKHARIGQVANEHGQSQGEDIEGIGKTALMNKAFAW
ncbi:hypothetical protein CR513_40539, partial [Mucuna pruriens]